MLEKKKTNIKYVVKEKEKKKFKNFFFAKNFYIYSY